MSKNLKYPKIIKSNMQILEGKKLSAEESYLVLHAI